MHAADHSIGNYGAETGVAGRRYCVGVRGHQILISRGMNIERVGCFDGFHGIEDMIDIYNRILKGSIVGVGQGHGQSAVGLHRCRSRNAFFISAVHHQLHAISLEAYGRIIKAVVNEYIREILRCSGSSRSQISALGHDTGYGNAIGRKSLCRIGINILFAPVTLCLCMIFCIIQLRHFADTHHISVRISICIILDEFRIEFISNAVIIENFAEVVILFTVRSIKQPVITLIERLYLCEHSNSRFECFLIIGSGGVYCHFGEAIEGEGDAAVVVVDGAVGGFEEFVGYLTAAAGCRCLGECGYERGVRGGIGSGGDCVRGVEEVVDIHAGGAFAGPYVGESDSHAVGGLPFVLAQQDAQVVYIILSVFVRAKIGGDQIGERCGGRIELIDAEVCALGQRAADGYAAFGNGAALNGSLVDHAPGTGLGLMQVDIFLAVGMGNFADAHDLAAGIIGDIVIYEVDIIRIGDFVIGHRLVEIIGFAETAVDGEIQPGVTVVVIHAGQHGDDLFIFRVLAFGSDNQNIGEAVHREADAAVAVGNAAVGGTENFVCDCAAVACGSRGGGCVGEFGYEIFIIGEVRSRGNRFCLIKEIIHIYGRNGFAAPDVIDGDVDGVGGLPFGIAVQDGESVFAEYGIFAYTQIAADEACHGFGNAVGLGRGELAVLGQGSANGNAVGRSRAVFNELGLDDAPLAVCIIVIADIIFAVGMGKIAYADHPAAGIVGLVIGYKVRVIRIGDIIINLLGSKLKALIQTAVDGVIQPAATVVIAHARQHLDDFFALLVCKVCYFRRIELVSGYDVGIFDSTLGEGRHGRHKHKHRQQQRHNFSHSKFHLYLLLRVPPDRVTIT